MLVLIASSFPEDAKGNAAYRAVLKLIKKTLNSGPDGFKDFHYLERRFNELGDIVVDWEYDRLDKRAQDNSIKFDKVDIIVVVGDLSTLPWEPSASQVVTLVHMAKHMNKPFVGIGFGALASIYTFSTKGARFNVLNGPFGGTIEELAMFPHYSHGSGAYPSGWLDRETGDVYTYNKTSREWVPSCNLGIHFVATKGIPGSPRAQPPTQHFVSYDDLADPTQPFQRQDANHEAVRFRSTALKSFVLRDVPTNSHSFLVDQYPEWYINREGALPTNDQLILLGETSKGPALLLRERMLLLGCRVDRTSQARAFECILSNFLHQIVALSMESTESKIELSMNEFLFGGVEMGHGKYDSARDRKPRTPALSRNSVRTVLKAGPVRVEPPVLEMFFRAATREQVDYFALTAKRRSSSVGRRPVVGAQNPQSMSARRKRLALALERIGMVNNSAAVQRGLQAGHDLDPDAERSTMPDSAREMLTGKVLKDLSVTVRRHHKDVRGKILSFDEISRLDYATIFPPTPKSALDLPLLPHLAEDLAPTPTPTSPRVRSPQRVTFSRPTSSRSGSRGRSRSPSASPTRPFQAQAVAHPTIPVPAIPQWQKVFLAADQSTVLNLEAREALSSRTMASSSTRSSAGSAGGGAGGRPVGITPWSASSAAPLPPSSPAPSARRAHTKSPRSVHAILRDAVATQYLPVHRPTTVAKPTKCRWRAAPECSDSDSGGGGGDSDSSDEEPPREQNVVTDVQVVASPRSRPHSNYRQLSQALRAQDEARAQTYEGYYTAGHRSLQETQAKLESESRRLNLAGDFKTYFNVHKSAMGWRPEGGIRSEGPYPAAPAFGFPPEMKAIEWHYVRQSDARDHENWVAGAWKS